MPRAKQRTPELRRRVLSVALAMLAKDGAGALTTRAVAQAAQTSVPAVYELFGDKRGLVRAVVFTGFGRLHEILLHAPPAPDPRGELTRVAHAFREFTQAEPVLSQLIFSRPIAEFDPSPADAAAGAAVRDYVITRVSRAIRAGVIEGDPVDVAHVLLATVQGLAVQESGGWLGSTPASAARRWNLAVAAVLRGLDPNPQPR